MNVSHYLHSRVLASDCRFNCHRRCEPSVPRNCPGERRGINGEGEQSFWFFSSLLWSCNRIDGACLNAPHPPPYEVPKNSDESGLIQPLFQGCFIDEDWVRRMWCEPAEISNEFASRKKMNNSRNINLFWIIPFPKRFNLIVVCSLYCHLILFFVCSFSSQ